MLSDRGEGGDRTDMGMVMKGKKELGVNAPRSLAD